MSTITPTPTNTQFAGLTGSRQKTVKKSYPSPPPTVSMARKVIIANNRLQNPPNVLYQLFPRDLVAYVKVQLEVLKELISSESKYEVINFHRLKSVVFFTF